MPDKTLPGVTYVAVDYAKPMDIATILEEHLIDTVVSCLMLTQTSVADAETAVIVATDSASCTRRFIASNWGPPTKEEYRDRSPWFPFQLAARERLRQTSLEWTEVATGYFLDYWGMPHMETNLTSDLPALDIVHGVAGVPGTGNEPIAFAYTYDVARVVAEVLTLPKWDETTYIVGDKMTWNEFIVLAEEARGFKFDVSYDGVEKLVKGDITELPNHREEYHQFPREELRAMYSGLGLSMASGTFDLDVDKSVHLQFPGLRMLTVATMLRDVWHQRQSLA